MWVSGGANHATLSRLGKRNLPAQPLWEQAGHLAERAVTGQSRGKLTVPSWYSPEFLEDQLVSRRCGEDRGPYQLRGASRRPSRHNSCPGRVPSWGGKWSQRTQAWNCKWQVTDLGKTAERTELPLHKRVFLGSQGEKDHWLPTGAFSLFIMKGFSEIKGAHMLFCAQETPTQAYVACRSIAQKNWGSLRFFMLFKLKRENSSGRGQ